MSGLRAKHDKVRYSGHDSCNLNTLNLENMFIDFKNTHFLFFCFCKGADTKQIENVRLSKRRVVRGLKWEEMVVEANLITADMNPGQLERISKR